MLHIAESTSAHFHAKADVVPLRISGRFAEGENTQGLRLTLDEAVRPESATYTVEAFQTCDTRNQNLSKFEKVLGSLGCLATEPHTFQTHFGAGMAVILDKQFIHT